MWWNMCFLREAAGQDDIENVQQHSGLAVGMRGLRRVQMCHGFMHTHSYSRGKEWTEKE